jgi:(p)ppGpp synthase/HD superfamily hydrolase
LHDTVDDPGTTFSQLKIEFGSAIKNIVEVVADDKELPKEVRKQIQTENAAHIEGKSKLVKLAD